MNSKGVNGERIIILEKIEKEESISKNSKLINFEFSIEKNILYPTKETVDKIHNLMIEMFADHTDPIDKGILSEANIEHSIYQAQRAGKSEKKVLKRLLIKAACLLHNLITSHPYVDGNKRTAFMTMMVFFISNGYRPVVPGQDKFYLKNVAFFRELAKSSTEDKSNIHKILEWMTRNIELIKEKPVKTNV